MPVIASFLVRLFSNRAFSAEHFLLWNWFLNIFISCLALLLCYFTAWHSSLRGEFEKEKNGIICQITHVGEHLFRIFKFFPAHVSCNTHPYMDDVPLPFEMLHQSLEAQHQWQSSSFRVCNTISNSSRVKNNVICFNHSAKAGGGVRAYGGAIYCVKCHITFSHGRWSEMSLSWRLFHHVFVMAFALPKNSSSFELFSSCGGNEIHSAL